MEGAQGKLMARRQDVQGARFQFTVELPAVQLARARKDGPSRLGFAVEKSDNNLGLNILRIDEHRDFDTPIVLHNSEQRDQRQPWLMIEQGDRIISLNNGITAGDKMLLELKKETASWDTNKMHFIIERQVGDRFEALDEPMARPRARMRATNSHFPASFRSQSLTSSSGKSSLTSRSKHLHRSCGDLLGLTRNSPMAEHCARRTFLGNRSAWGLDPSLPRHGARKPIKKEVTANCNVALVGIGTKLDGTLDRRKLFQGLMD